VTSRLAPFSAASLAALALTAWPAVAAGDFSYLPPGDLIPDSGEGRVDETIYAPGMRFPIEEGPAFANSQVYNAGGYLGPPGGQCDATNYDYPWRDNYCEIRQWDMPLCPAGTGHQGQDIRPATCEKSVHWAVAAVDGTITNIGSYSVYLTGADGTRYDYLHMSDVQVTVGQDVARGERIGKVSNEFGGTPTTIHLHFNLRQNVSGVGSVYVPPYMSLVAAYEELIGPPVGDPSSGGAGGQGGAPAGDPPYGGAGGQDSERDDPDDEAHADGDGAIEGQFRCACRTAGSGGDTAPGALAAVALAAVALGGRRRRHCR
jgi:MYXO-CTERM domain-containing protein